MRLIKNIGQKGDTIVEVMICLAVFAGMLSAAFVLTNRNQSTSQAAQERSVAVKISEGQLEKLRAYADRSEIPAFDYFCMNESGAPVELEGPDEGCSSSESEGRYTYVIYSPSRAVEIGGNGGAFAVKTDWEGLITVAEEVKIFYSLFDSGSPTLGGGGDPIVFPGPSIPDPAGPNPVTGYLSVAADCYNGCPEMKAVFTWSTGETTEEVWTVSNPYLASGSFVNANYSFTPGVDMEEGAVLESVRVNMTNDAFDNAPNKDRNVYVALLSHDGQTYPHTAATPTPCPPGAGGPGYYNGSDAKWLCNNDPVTFMLNGPPPAPARYTTSVNGINYTACSNISSTPVIIPIFGNVSGCLTNVLNRSVSTYAPSKVTYAMTPKSGPAKIIIEYASLYNPTVNVKIGNHSFNTSLPVAPFAYTREQVINIPENAGNINNVELSWNTQNLGLEWLEIRKITITNEGL